MFYDKNNALDEIYTKSVIQELDNNYDRVLGFFGLKDDSLSEMDKKRGICNE